MEKNIFLNDDYLVLISKLQQNSVDFILIDPPYGKIDGMKLSGQSEAVDWDVKIDWRLMFSKFYEVLKPGGTIAVFGQNPTYSELILSNLRDYKYEYVWLKNNAAQGFHANKMPLVFSENIAIFIKSGDKRTFNKPSNVEEIDKKTHFNRWYSQQLFFFIGKTRRQIHEILGHRKLEFYFMYNGKHFGLLSQQLYEELISKFKINEFKYFLPYEEIKKIWEKEKNHSKGISLDSTKYVGTFSNILSFSKDYKPYFHPTQKPIDLIKKLIQIYSNEGDVIMDCFAGSGTTLVAAKELNRFYVGSEISKKYFDIAIERLNTIF